MKVSIIIPALNEEAGIKGALNSIPKKELAAIGWDTEVIVVDNGSTDNTAQIAGDCGAKVIHQPKRGYGNAYKAGFANATGDFIATGDADMTYPFDILPQVLTEISQKGYDFLNTDRLTNLNPEAMSTSHIFGNWFLSTLTRLLFGWPFKDSQSGMWIFKRSILNELDVRSGGMPFSQELKIEAYVKGFVCHEVPIDYRVRAGEVKLNPLKDGLDNTLQLFRKRLTLKKARR